MKYYLFIYRIKARSCGNLAFDYNLYTENGTDDWKQKIKNENFGVWTREINIQEARGVHYEVRIY